jgi:hypothetical protein
MQSLLPLYGLAHGFDDAGAARLVAIFSLGEAVLVAGLGWMADRYGRQLTLKLCVLIAMATSALLPFSVGTPLLLWPVLFFAGGTVAGIYTLGIVLIGQDFRSQKLAVVSTGFAMAYAAGSIIGSAPVGYLIDLFGPEALPVSIALGFLALAIYLFLGGETVEDDESEDEPSRIKPVPNLTYLEDRLFEEGETAASAAAAVMETPSHMRSSPMAEPIPYKTGPSSPSASAESPAQPPKRNDERYRRETSLEEVFRQRAIEIAERVAERQRPGETTKPAMTEPAKAPLPRRAPSTYSPPRKATPQQRSKLTLS